jgi:carboxymethylenebutenolidase
MGQDVSFASDGAQADGYLSIPAAGEGAGVLVLQEWWGLVPQIKRVCDRLAAEGFTALAPDLFHGEIAQHDEMDKAAHLLSTLPLDRAARDMTAAIDYLLAHDAVRSDRVGVVGFCMGGMLTLVIAAQQGERIAAAVPFYGAPLGDNAPDWSGLTAPVHGHFAGDDAFFAPDAVRELEAQLRGMGKDVTFEMHPGTGHAFANEENALGTYDPDAATTAWSKAVAFLQKHLA